MNPKLMLVLLEEPPRGERLSRLSLPIANALTALLVPWWRKENLLFDHGYPTLVHLP